MNIIILGAGQVGTTVARHLTHEQSNLTIVDQDLNCLTRLQSQLDIRTVQGNAAHPRVLKEAGAEEADMILAVTNSDETNMVACQIAYSLFQTPTKVARVRATEYLKYEDLFGTNAFPIDVIISPEQLVANHIYQLIMYPEATQVLDFANKHAKLVHIKVAPQAPIIGKALKQLPELFNTIEIRIAAVFRDNQAFFPTGKTAIQVNDEVFFLCSAHTLSKAITLFKQQSDPARNIFLAGGGNVGSILAEKLDPYLPVKIIEHNPKKVRHLTMTLENSLILAGEVTDKTLLTREHVGGADIFCALTNRDENNMLSAMLAKKLGAKKAIALINRNTYTELIDRTDIDIPVSPQQITISSLLSHIRQGDVVKVHSLKQGHVEALETIVHGPKAASFVIGKQLGEINLPKEANIVGIVRGKKVFMANPKLTIQAEDHIIIFMTHHNAIPYIEQLFQTQMPVL